MSCTKFHAISDNSGQKLVHLTSSLCREKKQHGPLVLDSTHTTCSYFMLTFGWKMLRHRQIQKSKTKIRE